MVEKERLNNKLQQQKMGHIFLKMNIQDVEKYGAIILNTIQRPEKQYAKWKSFWIIIL